MPVTVPAVLAHAAAVVIPDLAPADWNEEEWEVGEDRLWEERDRQHSRAVAAAEQEVKAAVAERVRRLKSESDAHIGPFNSFTGAINRGALSFVQTLRNTRRIVPEDGFSLPNGATLTAAAATLKAAAAPSANLGTQAGRVTAGAATQALGAHSKTHSAAGSESEGRAPKDDGCLLEPAAAVHAQDAGARHAHFAKQAWATDDVADMPKLDAATKAGRRQLGTHSVARRPLPMVALEIEQRLGDLFTGGMWDVGNGSNHQLPGSHAAGVSTSLCCRAVLSAPSPHCARDEGGACVQRSSTSLAGMTCCGTHGVSN